MHSFGMAVFMFFFFLSPIPVFAASAVTSHSMINFDMQIPIPRVSITNNDISTGNAIALYINGIYQFGVKLAAILAVMVIVYGGLVWLTAAGDKGRVGEAEKIITNALIGLVLSLGSYLLLDTINPDLKDLKRVTLTGIDPHYLNKLPYDPRLLPAGTPGCITDADCVPGLACRADTSGVKSCGAPVTVSGTTGSTTYAGTLTPGGTLPAGLRDICCIEVKIESMLNTIVMGTSYQMTPNDLNIADSSSDAKVLEFCTNADIRGGASLEPGVPATATENAKKNSIYKRFLCKKPSTSCPTLDSTTGATTPSSSCSEI